MKIELSTERAFVASAAGPRPERQAPASAPASALPIDAAPAVQPSVRQIDAAIEAANRSVRAVTTNLKFEKDNSSGKIVVRVIDSETQQVLRQMPSEEMLSMSKALDSLKGLMIHLKV